MTGPVAAIDCGTNSTRLLIVEGGETRERRTSITRLGERVGVNGQLDREAIARTLDRLRTYRDLLDHHHVSALRITATSAARDASNRAEFLTAAAEIVGADVELLAGDEEAALSFLGAASTLGVDDGPYLVVDIGGGSTEFSYGTERCEASLSTDIGCVRLTEKYIHHDPPRPEELVACLSLAELHVNDLARAIPRIGDGCRLVGVAGTITTAAAVELGLMEYDREQIHHMSLSKEAAEDVFRTLAVEAREDRIHNPGLEDARADVIVAGMCILVTVMRYFDFDSCLVSETDILDGLVLSQSL